MPDFLDNVTDREAREQERLAANLRQAAAKRESLAGRTTCNECGEPIPAKRREALPYVQCCIDCAVFEDLRARRQR